MKKNTAVVEFTHLFDKRGAKLLTGKTMIKHLVAIWVQRIIREVS